MCNHIHQFSFFRSQSQPASLPHAPPFANAGILPVASVATDGNHAASSSPTPPPTLSPQAPSAPDSGSSAVSISPFIYYIFNKEFSSKE